MRTRLIMGMLLIPVGLIYPAGSASAESFSDAETAALDRLCEIREAIFDFYDNEGWLIEIAFINWAVDRGYIVPDWNLLEAGYTMSVVRKPSYGILVRPDIYGPERSRSFFMDAKWRVHHAENVDAHDFSPLLERDPCGQQMTDETAALRDLVALLRAQQHLYDQLGFFAGTFEELQDDYYLLYCGWSVERHGYRFYMEGGGQNFAIVAMPTTGASPIHRAFYVDQSAVIRMASRGSAGAGSAAYDQPYPEPSDCLSVIVSNEREVLNLLCEVQEAQENYKVTNGHYTVDFGDIDDDLSFFPHMTTYGYDFVLFGSQESYGCSVNASVYGFSGMRGFILRANSIVRAAYLSDAFTDDPIIGVACELPGPSHIGTPSEVRYHSADFDQDNRLSLTELLRIIQLYNSGSFQCASGSEDGYTPGRDNLDCEPHSADFDNTNFYFNLSELLRAIQLFSGLGYYPCNSGEDGFCGVPRG